MKSKLIILEFFYFWKLFLPIFVIFTKNWKFWISCSKIGSNLAKIDFNFGNLSVKNEEKIGNFGVFLFLKTFLANFCNYLPKIGNNLAKINLNFGDISVLFLDTFLANFWNFHENFSVPCDFIYFFFWHFSKLFLMFETWNFFGQFFKNLLLFFFAIVVIVTVS